MANNFVTINGKKYRSARRTFKEKQARARQINVTIGGTVAAQDFSFSGQRWEMAIWVELTPEDSSYGSKANLEAAYALASFTFIDPFGTSHTATFEGDLELPPAYSLVDISVPFEVEISLRKLG